jgi:DNA-binding response OmpR family regulator
MMPVVFVTSRDDFEARKESTRCGGSDLIVKPFLFPEVSVKALTLTLRNRIQNQSSPV